MSFSTTDLEVHLLARTKADQATKQTHWLKHYAPQLQTIVVSSLKGVTATEVAKKNLSIDFHALGKSELIPVENFRLPGYISEYLEQEFPGFKFTVEEGSELVPEWGPTEPAYYSPFKKLHISWH
jgi:hypothetical protein